MGLIRRPLLCEIPLSDNALSGPLPNVNQFAFVPLHPLFLASFQLPTALRGKRESWRSERPTGTRVRRNWHGL